MSPKLLFVVATLVVAFSSRAQDSSESPANSEALLKELAAIKARYSQSRGKRFETLAANFLAASQSNDRAARAYSEAVRDANYSAGSGSARRFQDWRDRNKELLTKDKAFGTAARLHFQYLAITLLRAANPDGDSPLRNLWDYILNLSQALTEFGDDLVASEPGKVLLQESIVRSPIVRANRLSADLENLQNWELVAGSLVGILDQNVREPLRKLKDPRLLETWSLQITVQRKGMERSGGELTKANFEQIEVPQLYWNQARDMILIGQKAHGIGEMTKLIRANPMHPNLDTWIKELSAVLKPEEVTQPPVAD